MRTPRTGWILAGTVIFGALLSCNDPVGPPLPCLGDVEVTVAGGAIPEFNWAPVCALSSLVVFDAADQVYWNVQAPVGTNELRPSVQYGRIPSGASQEGPLISLQPGFGYVVRVFRLDTDEEDQPISVLAGEATFQR